MLFDQDKTILDLCGGTGAWSRPYKDAGYNVILVTHPDLDVVNYEPPDDVYGILAAPPCTHFSVSGAQYWDEKDREGVTQWDLNIVAHCCRLVVACKPKFWALENPVGRLKRWLGDPVYSFNPCDFGGYLNEGEYTNPLAPRDAYTKKTLLWGNFKRPSMRPVEPIYKYASNGDRYSPINMATGGKTDKTKESRSVTPAGFARAFFEANR